MHYRYDENGDYRTPSPLSSEAEYDESIYGNLRDMFSKDKNFTSEFSREMPRGRSRSPSTSESIDAEKELVPLKLEFVRDYVAGLGLKHGADWENISSEHKPPNSKVSCHLFFILSLARSLANSLLKNKSRNALIKLGPTKSLT